MTGGAAVGFEQQCALTAEEEAVLRRLGDEDRPNGASGQLHWAELFNHGAMRCEKVAAHLRTEAQVVDSMTFVDMTTKAQTLAFMKEQGVSRHGGAHGG